MGDGESRREGRRGERQEKGSARGETGSEEMALGRQRGPCQGLYQISSDYGAGGR